MISSVEVQRPADGHTKCGIRAQLVRKRSAFFWADGSGGCLRKLADMYYIHDPWHIMAVGQTPIFTDHIRTIHTLQIMLIYSYICIDMYISCTYHRELIVHLISISVASIPHHFHIFVDIVIRPWGQQLSTAVANSRGAETCRPWDPLGWRTLDQQKHHQNQTCREKTHYWN